MKLAMVCAPVCWPYSISNGVLGTLDVRIRATPFIPANIFSRFAILCAIARQIYLIIKIRLSGELDSLTPNVFVLDQLSAGVPLLRSEERRVGKECPV